jgi:hypothetical protein
MHGAVCRATVEDMDLPVGGDKVPKCKLLFLSMGGMLCCIMSCGVVQGNSGTGWLQDVEGHTASACRATACRLLTLRCHGMVM